MFFENICIINIFSGNTGRLGKSEALYVFFLDTPGILKKPCFGRDRRPEPAASQQPHPHPTLTTLVARDSCALRFPKLRLFRASSGRGHSHLQCCRKSGMLRTVPLTCTNCVLCLAHAGTNENTTKFCNDPFLVVPLFLWYSLFLVRAASPCPRVGGA